jgi:hypothetical protein
LGKSNHGKSAQQTAQQNHHSQTLDSQETVNRQAWGEGWEEIRIVNKCGPYRYFCWRGDQGRRKAKYLGKVQNQSKATAADISAGDTSI